MLAGSNRHPKDVRRQFQAWSVRTRRTAPETTRTQLRWEVFTCPHFHLHHPIFSLFRTHSSQQRVFLCCKTFIPCVRGLHKLQFSHLVNCRSAWRAVGEGYSDMDNTRTQHEKLAEVYVIKPLDPGVPKTAIGKHCLRLGVHPACRNVIRLDSYASK